MCITPEDSELFVVSTSPSVSAAILEQHSSYIFMVQWVGNFLWCFHSSKIFHKSKSIIVNIIVYNKKCTMFGNLKDRLYDVQHDLTQGYVFGGYV